ncbi:MAG: hypothetical protein M3442_09115, partial [Chloroflexota bacterium]|nr:hypothetical protein [Chloroflexota bacterium]
MPYGLDASVGIDVRSERCQAGTGLIREQAQQAARGRRGTPRHPAVHLQAIAGGEHHRGTA